MWTDKIQPETERLVRMKFFFFTLSLPPLHSLYSPMTFPSVLNPSLSICSKSKPSQTIRKLADTRGYQESNRGTSKSQYLGTSEGKYYGTSEIRYWAISECRHRDIRRWSPGDPPQPCHRSSSSTFGLVVTCYLQSQAVQQMSMPVDGHWSHAAGILLTDHFMTQDLIAWCTLFLSLKMYSRTSSIHVKIFFFSNILMFLRFIPK